MGSLIRYHKSVNTKQGHITPLSYLKHLLSLYSINRKSLSGVFGHDHTKLRPSAAVLAGSVSHESMR